MHPSHICGRHRQVLIRLSVLHDENQVIIFQDELDILSRVTFNINPCFIINKVG